MYSLSLVYSLSLPVPELSLPKPPGVGGPPGAAGVNLEPRAADQSRSGPGSAEEDGLCRGTAESARAGSGVVRRH